MTRGDSISTLQYVNTEDPRFQKGREIWDFGSIFAGEFRFFVRNTGHVRRAGVLMGSAICATNFIIYTRKTTEKRI